MNANVETEYCVVCGRRMPVAAVHVDTCGERCFRKLLARQRAVSELHPNDVAELALGSLSRPAASEKSDHACRSGYRLAGHDAIDYAVAHGLQLCKHADPMEEARNDLTVSEAREVAAQDAGLVYLDVIETRAPGSGAPHDVERGACACGAWHGGADESAKASANPDYPADANPLE